MKKYLFYYIGIKIRKIIEEIIKLNGLEGKI